MSYLLILPNELLLYLFKNLYHGYDCWRLAATCISLRNIYLTYEWEIMLLYITYKYEGYAHISFVGDIRHGPVVSQHSICYYNRGTNMTKLGTYTGSIISNDHRLQFVSGLLDGWSCSYKDYYTLYWDGVKIYMVYIYTGSITIYRERARKYLRINRILCHDIIHKFEIDNSLVPVELSRRVIRLIIKRNQIIKLRIDDRIVVVDTSTATSSYR